MTGRFTCILSLLSILIALPSPWLKAQWIEDGVPVCTAIEHQYGQTIVSDGSGGAIITWLDYRNGSDNIDIYAQRIDGDGYLMWAADGIAVCNASGRQERINIASDGAGGAIIVWHDYRNVGPDIYAQRITGDGLPIWRVDGIVISDAVGEQKWPGIESDGSGGAYIAWLDYRNDIEEVYAQRVDGNGTNFWRAMGVCISSDSVGQSYSRDYPEIIQDGFGGAIIGWRDRRSGKEKYYLQRVDGEANPLWAAGGVSVSEAHTHQFWYDLASDNAHGALIAWRSERADVYSHYDLYVQRVLSDGSVAWGSASVPICVSSAWWVRSPHIISSGSGNALICWQDGRDGRSDIYAQKVDSLGAVLWTHNGIAICDADGSQGSPRMISDSEEGALIVWGDSRNNKSNIYAQRINSDGVPYWTYNGIAVYASDDDTNMGFPEMIHNGLDAAIVAWSENRSDGTLSNIYSKKVCLDGSVPVPTLLQQFSCGRSGNGIEIRWTMSEADESFDFRISRSVDGDRFLAIEPSPVVRQDRSYVYTDETCEFGRSYRYRIELLDGDGERVLFETDTVYMPEVPLTLYQNYPNPFNPLTTIRYYLPEAVWVLLEIYDPLGRKTAVLVDEYQEKGPHKVVWKPNTERGFPGQSGVYFCRLQAGKTVLSKK